MANNAEELFETIELYLEGKLKGEALLSFESRLHSDKDFAKDFAIHKKLYLLQQRNGAEAKKIRATLQEIHGEETAKVFPMKKMLAMAASFLLLVGLALFLFIPKNDQGNLVLEDKTAIKYNNLFAKYAQYDLLSILTRSTHEEAALKKTLEDSFKDKKYETFLASSDEYLAKHPDDYDVLLAKAITQIETEKYDAALKTLDELQQSDVRKNKAKWYRALLFLKQKDQNNCRKYLEEIMEEKSYNAGKAGELLKELEGED